MENIRRVWLRGFGAARSGMRLVLLALLTQGIMLVLRLRMRSHRNADLPGALRFGHAWARTAVRALGVKVDRRGYIPAERVLVVANHRSYIDIPILLSALPCVFLAKREVADWPLFGTAAELQSTVWVDRACPESRKQAVERAEDVLARGISFAAFPEGTTTAGPGINSFYPGLFRLAERRGFPVLPVALSYSDPSAAFVDDVDFLTHFLACFGKRRTRVRVEFGPLIRPGDAVDTRARAEAWIRTRLESLDKAALAPAHELERPERGAWPRFRRRGAALGS
jgi:1-acyl-sn-glycerol-3-phosphate acyltransferase